MIYRESSKTKKISITDLKMKNEFVKKTIISTGRFKCLKNVMILSSLRLMYKIAQRE